jgi:hypothetical protein
MLLTTGIGLPDIRGFPDFDSGSNYVTRALDPVSAGREDLH